MYISTGSSRTKHLQAVEQKYILQAVAEAFSGRKHFFKGRIESTYYGNNKSTYFRQWNGRLRQGSSCSVCSGCLFQQMSSWWVGLYSTQEALITTQRRHYIRLRWTEPENVPKYSYKDSNQFSWNCFLTSPSSQSTLALSLFLLDFFLLRRISFVGGLLGGFISWVFGI